MEIACEDASNETIRASALELLSRTHYGCWVLLPVGLVGVINNTLLLLVAHRLQWLYQPQYALIVAQTCVDMLLSVLMIAQSLYPLSFYYTGTPNILTQAGCVGWYIPFQIAQDADQRTSLMVAIDRLINAIVPFQWAALGWSYRLIMLGIAWSWALVEELTWLAFTEDVCVKICITDSYPSSGWDTFVMVSDTLSSAIIIFSYLILPPLSGSVLKRLNCSHLVVAIDHMEQREREIVRRVRRLSVLTIVSYVCTTFVGFTLCDIMEMQGNQLDEYQKAFLEPFIGVLCSSSAVIPLFLFAWREPSVREQLHKIFCWPIEGRKRKATVQTVVSLERDSV